MKQVFFAEKNTVEPSAQHIIAKRAFTADLHSSNPAQNHQDEEERCCSYAIRHGHASSAHVHSNTDNDHMKPLMTAIYNRTPRATGTSATNVVNSGCYCVSRSLYHF